MANHHKNQTLSAVVLLSCLAIGTAYASQNQGGFSVGIKAGYNDMDYPTYTKTETDYIDGFAFNTTEKASKDKYIADIHIAYLFPIANHFQLGGLVGYSNYGDYKITDDFLNVATTSKVSANIYSYNLEAVGQFNIDQWFIQGRVGAAHVQESFSSSGNDTEGDSDNLALTHKWLPAAGASVGYFFNDHVSTELFVDHIFGENYKTESDLENSTSNKPASMTSIGLGLTYSF